MDDLPEFHRHCSEDGNLELDSFHCDAATRDMVRVCLRYQDAHNLRAMGLLPGPGPVAVAPEGLAAVL